MISRRYSEDKPSIHFSYEESELLYASVIAEENGLLYISVIAEENGR